MSGSLLIERSAVISADEIYRYRADRRWSIDGPVAAFFMVNPSWGDGYKDDQTFRKLMGFTSRLRFSRFIVGNKFAFRSPNPGDLLHAADPIGPENDKYLYEIAREADIHIVAWGTMHKLPLRLRERWQAVIDILEDAGAKPMCFGLTKDGHPLHPLTIDYNHKLKEWNPPHG